MLRGARKPADHGVGLCHPFNGFTQPELAWEGKAIHA